MLWRISPAPWERCSFFSIPLPFKTLVLGARPKFQHQFQCSDHIRLEKPLYTTLSTIPRILLLFFVVDFECSVRKQEIPVGSLEVVFVTRFLHPLQKQVCARLVELFSQKGSNSFLIKHHQAWGWHCLSLFLGEHKNWVAHLASSPTHTVATAWWTWCGEPHSRSQQSSAVEIQDECPLEGIFPRELSTQRRNTQIFSGAISIHPTPK